MKEYRSDRITRAEIMDMTVHDLLNGVSCAGVPCDVCVLYVNECCLKNLLFEVGK